MDKQNIRAYGRLGFRRFYLYQRGQSEAENEAQYCFSPALLETGSDPVQRELGPEITSNATTHLFSQMVAWCIARIRFYFQKPEIISSLKDRMRICSANSSKPPFFTLLVTYLQRKKMLPWEHITRQPRWLGMMPDSC